MSAVEEDVVVARADKDNRKKTEIVGHPLWSIIENPKALGG